MRLSIDVIFKDNNFIAVAPTLLLSLRIRAGSLKEP